MLETYHSWTMNFGFIALCFFVGAASYTTFADTKILDHIDDRSHKSPPVMSGDLTDDRKEMATF